jgi:hypothetical protein
MKLKNLFTLFLFIAVIFSPIIAHEEIVESLVEYAIAEEFADYTPIECELRLKHRSSRKFGQDFTITDPKSSYASFTHPHIPIAESASQNWSGYAIATSLTHPASNVVNAVYGSWIVPTIAAVTHNTWCSLWVGIDGYSNSTVEQIGTEHDWSNGRQIDYAWFEMYPSFSYEIVGFPLRSGDSITGSVVYRGNGVFVLTIANNTRRVFTTIPTSYTTSRTAQRSSAEWIVEAPYLNGILPLSHFGTAIFSNCTATINNVHGSINSLFWAHDPLTMVTANNVAKAVPSALSVNGQNFTVRWQHE